MPAIKLKSIEFLTPAFRKLKEIKIDFAERITVIAGHNGIGKSTILGLVSNGSGLSEAKFTSYLNKAFQANMNEIVHLDYQREYEDYRTNQTQLPTPQLTYEVEGQPLVKRCSTTGRTDSKRVRVVPRTEPHEVVATADGMISIGPDAKVPLPTIYLGMTRMLPVGESNPAWVDSSQDKTIDPADASFIKNFVNGVILTGRSSPTSKTITTQTIKGTGKTAKHPEYAHSPKCVSLGQDSLSAIATAVASFQKLKREWSEYPGGLLVIDEIDAGFHPHAQEQLMRSLAAAARSLNLQVIATTHSMRLIEAVHPDAQPARPRNAKLLDSVVYLTDTAAPRLADDYTLHDIRHDMSLTVPPAARKTATKKLKIYLEDPEAHAFLVVLLTAKLKRKVKTAANVGLTAIPLSSGCENLKGFVKHDPYFSTVLIVLDADASLAGLGRNVKNIVKLPGGRNVSGKGISPEATLYYFIEALAQPADNYPAARSALRRAHVTSDYLRQHLLNGDTNITDRVSAKKWMTSRLQRIQDWKLIELWALEHPEQVNAFEEAFVAAAVATAKAS